MAGASVAHDDAGRSAVAVLHVKSQRRAAGNPCHPTCGARHPRWAPEAAAAAEGRSGAPPPLVPPWGRAAEGLPTPAAWAPSLHAGGGAPHGLFVQSGQAVVAAICGVAVGCRHRGSGRTCSQLLLMGQPVGPAVRLASRFADVVAVEVEQAPACRGGPACRRGACMTWLVAGRRASAPAKDCSTCKGDVRLTGP